MTHATNNGLPLWMLTRREHPETSHAAAEGHVMSGTRGLHFRMCVDLVREYPGRTTLELEKLSDGALKQHQIGRRLPELRTLGRMRNGDNRRCSVGGRLMQTWHVVETVE